MMQCGVDRADDGDGGQINACAPLSPQVPFGGVKQSGFGKELGEYALEA